MVRELKELGVELAVSVWPTIDEKSINYGEMNDRGYLVKTDRASGFHMNWMGDTTFSMQHIREQDSLSGTVAKRIITIRASTVSGLMKLNRNTVRMISMYSDTMKARRSSALTFIR